jgi:hypothetical protein
MGQQLRSTTREIDRCARHVDQQRDSRSRGQVLSRRQIERRQSRGAQPSLIACQSAEQPRDEAEAGRGAR